MEKLLEDIKAFHNAFISNCAQRANDYNPVDSKIEDDVDDIARINDALQWVESVEKQLKAMRMTLVRTVCLKWLGVGTGEPIRGKLVTGSPEVKTGISLPKPDSPEYVKLCDYFGVPSSGPFRPHWPTVVEMIAELQKEGKPLPDGIDPNKTFQVFEVRTRKR